MTLSALNATISQLNPAQNAWTAFAVRRAVGLIVSLALLVGITFLIVPLIPGDPALAILGADAQPDAIAITRERLGLDLPIGQQFLNYLAGILSFDLGTSFRYNVPVSSIIATRLVNTAAIAFVATLVVVLIAVPIGMAIAVLTRGGRRPALGHAFGATTGFFSSIPGYVTGALLVLLFAVQLRLLPAGGATEPGWLLLPVVALAVGPIATVARVVRQETYTVLQQDHMRTARSHRIGRLRLYVVDALPNLLANTLALAGIVLAGLMGGTVIIENVFNVPGLGLGVIEAITDKDYPVIQGIILVIGGITITINLLIDVLIAVVDPRTLTGANHG